MSEKVRLDWNVNLTAEVDKAEWERALREAEEDEDRNPQDEPVVHLAWRLSGDIEGSEITLAGTDVEFSSAWISTADPPTVLP